MFKISETVLKSCKNLSSIFFFWLYRKNANHRKYGKHKLEKKWKNYNDNTSIITAPFLMTAWYFVVRMFYNQFMPLLHYGCVSMFSLFYKYYYDKHLDAEILVHYVLNSFLRIDSQSKSIKLVDINLIKALNNILSNCFQISWISLYFCLLYCTSLSLMIQKFLKLPLFIVSILEKSTKYSFT